MNGKQLLYGRLKPNGQLDDFYSRGPLRCFYQHNDDDPVDIEEFIRIIYEARDQ